MHCSDDDSSSPQDLRNVDQKTVAVRLPVGRETRLLKGSGAFVRDPKLGDLLCVSCIDDAGTFELLIKEDEWSGSVQSGESVGCDYLIRLDRHS